MPRSLTEIYRLLDKQAAFVFGISDGGWWIQRVFVNSGAYLPNSTASQNRQSPLAKPQSAQLMLPATQRFVARRDVRNEKTSFNPVQTENTEAILKNYELVI